MPKWQEASQPRQTFQLGVDANARVEISEYLLDVRWPGCSRAQSIKPSLQAAWRGLCIKAGGYGEFKGPAVLRISRTAMTVSAVRP